MLSQTFENRNAGDLELVTNGNKVDLGVYSSLIHKHDLTRELGISLTLDVNHILPHPFDPKKDEFFSETTGEFVYSFNNKSQKPRFKKLTVSAIDSTGKAFRIPLIRSNQTKSSDLLVQPLGRAESVHRNNTVRFKLEKRFSVTKTLYALNTSSIMTALDHFGATGSRLVIEMNKLISRWLVKRRKGSVNVSQFLRERTRILKEKSDIERLESRKVIDDFLTNSLFFGDDQYIPFALIRGDGAEGVGARSISARLRHAPLRASEASVLSGAASGVDVSAIAKAIDSVRIGAAFEASIANFSRRCNPYISNLRHVKPLRALPTRFVDQTREEDLNIDERFGEEINQCLKKIGFPYSLKVDRRPDPILGNVQTVRLFDERLQTEVALSDVGFGISQILPIIRAGIVAKFGNTQRRSPRDIRDFSRRIRSLILVEQPEIHIHPKAQAELGEFFAETIRDQRDQHISDSERSSRLSAETSIESTNEIQWVIETHSEALLLRLLKLVRKGELLPGDIAINYVQIDRSLGSASVTEIEVSPEGNFLSEWPNGFFEERMDELFD
jgi:hypothetical protein